MYMEFKDKLNGRIGRNSTHSIFDQVLSIGMNVLLSILFSRYLGAESLGQYTLGLALVGILAVFSNFGITTIMSREIAKSAKKTKLYLGNALGIKLFISFPLLIIFTVIAVYIFPYSDDTAYIIILIAIYNTFVSSITYVGSALVSLHRNDILLKINIINKSISLVGVFVLLGYGYKLTEVLYLFIVVSGVLFLFAISQVKVIVPDFKVIFNKRFNKAYILLSFPLVIASAAELISLRVDTVFIGAMLDETSVGLYSASYNIYMGAILIPLALIKVYFPNFINHYQESEEKAFLLYKKYFIFIFIYSVLMAFFLILCGEFIIINLYGNEFQQSVLFLIYLSFLLPVINARVLVNYTLLALKKNSYYFKITLLGTCINLTLNYILILEYGILGAVFSTIATELVVMMLGLYKIISLKNV
jgi:O-antigen/teichoic acid export membrane protein